jgi:hypothetical protein
MVGGDLERAIDKMTKAYKEIYPDSDFDIHSSMMNRGIVQGQSRISQIVEMGCRARGIY